MIVDDEFIATLIDDREKGWSDRPPDPPTNMGMSLPQWRRYCMFTHQNFRGDKRGLRAATRDDAFAFYRWYFAEIGIAGMEIQPVFFDQILDLFVLHSKGGVDKILSGVPDILGFPSNCGIEYMMANVQNQAISSAIALSRIIYMSEVADDKPMLRGNVRGWVIRALKMGGLWPRGQ